MARRSGSLTAKSFLRSGRKTDYSWQGFRGVSLNNSAAGTIDAIVTSNIPATLTRTRGELLVMMDTAAISDSLIAAFGIIVATDAQVAAGVTSVPSPLDVMEADWLWHGFAPMRSETATQENQLGGQVFRLNIDSKAMRKIKENSVVLLVSDGVVLGGTPTYDFVWGIRLLFGD